jgi:hypothetical protein
MVIKKIKGYKLGNFEKQENEFISISLENIAICMNHVGKRDWELKPCAVIE